MRQTEINSMLHVMLRMGLLDDLKDISGHKYDSIKDFNKLRQLENDYKNRTKPITAKSAPSDQDELLELKVKTTHCYMENISRNLEKTISDLF